MELERIRLPELLTVQEVMEYLKICRTTLWRITKLGELYPIKVGRQLRYPSDDILLYSRGYKVPAPTSDPYAAADPTTFPPTPSLLDEADR